MIWYPNILKDLKEECNVDVNVSLEDAVYNHNLGSK